MKFKNIILKNMVIIILFFSLFFQNFWVLPIFATEYTQILPKIESYISSQLTSDTKNILLITINDVSLDSSDQYQKLHDILQNKFTNKHIVDIYIDKNKNITIPQLKFDLQKDDENSYDQTDITFKSMLNTVNINNISLINEQKNYRIPQIYYHQIIYCIYTMYGKIMSLTNNYINHVYNPLVKSLKIDDISKTPNAVGEFDGLNNKLVIVSPKLFNNNFSNFNFSNFNNLNFNNQEILKDIEHTINHELGHAIELALVEKIFQDISKEIYLKISSEGLKTLASVYFSGGNSVIGTTIQKNILSAMNVPNLLSEQKKFIRENLTEYANTNTSEFFAEAIAYGSFKDDSQNKNISKFVEQEITNIINSQGSVYEAEKKSIYDFLKENISI